MNQKVTTVDGMGTLLETAVSRSGTSYRVAGNGFSGWYASHEIKSDLDDDETTTLLPFTDDDTDNDDSTNVAPEDDPHAEDGVILPWDPSPTDEWDGQLTQQPDGGDISLDPTRSTTDGNFDEDPESSTQVFGKTSGISWSNPEQTEGQTPSGHYISVNHDSPTSIDWDIHDGKGNSVMNGSHAASGRGGLSDNDFDHAYSLMEDDAHDVGARHASIQRAAFRSYETILNNDSMIREAAWADVRKKASRLFRGGMVTVKKITPREIFASVVGDNGTYDTQVHRKNAFGQGVTWWDCDCAWGKHAYLRQRTFIGRMCSHAFATYTAMQSKVVPEKKTKTINRTVERHSLAASDVWPGAGSGEDPKEYGFDPADDSLKTNQSDNTNRYADPWQDPKQNQQYVRKSAFNPGSDSADEYVYEPVRESLAARQGGLMVWDEDLAKVMKQIYNQQPPAGAGAPGAAPMAPGGDPQAAAGVPGGLGMDPSQLAADPSGDAGDPSMMGGDPSMGGDPAMDPTQGDPNGAGLAPANATPSFVRSTPGTPTVPGSVQSSSNYPTRRALRHFQGEFTDGDPDDNFEEWGDPNSEDADTFNTVQDLTDDNDPDLGFYDDFYGRSSARTSLTEDQFTGGDQFPTGTSDPAPGQDVNTPAVPENQLPMVPRMTQTSANNYNIIPNDSNDPHQTPYIPAARQEFQVAHPAQKYIPKVFRQSPPLDREASLGLGYLMADADPSWQKNPDTAQNVSDNDDYDQDSEDYENHEEDRDGKTSSLDSLASWFEDDNSSHTNMKQAEAFNDDSDEIVREFQRSAAGRQLTSGRHFTFGEQQDLIDEDGVASQLGNLNLKNSFYEDQ